MALEAFLAEAETERITKLNKCSVFVLLQTLDKDDQATLLAWVADPTKSAPLIVTGLQRAGLDAPSASAIAKHRRRECACRVA